MKYTALFCAALMMTGCITVAPNDSASARRDRALETGEPIRPPAAPAPQGAPLEPANAAQLPSNTDVRVEASPTNAQPQIVVQTEIDNGAISDEQDFGAVDSRRSIESDAERLEQNRAQYTVIQPTDLPSRRGTGPNIVEYAVTTNNPVGVQLYRRIGFNRENRAIRACSKYATSDLAQQAFLAAGGPVRDRKGLDPDGDGFACAWDPTPFRLALQN